MRNKKLIILVVLSAAAVISLLYGVTASSKGRRSSGKARDVQARAEIKKQGVSIVFAPRSAKKSAYPLWNRDPFSLSSASVKRFKGLNLNGILWDQDSPLAIINDRIVRAGDIISGNAIIEIREDRVILSDGTKEFELTLK